MVLFSSQHSTGVPQMPGMDPNFALVIVVLGGVLIVVVVCVTAIIAIINGQRMKAESKDLTLEVGEASVPKTAAREQARVGAGEQKSRTPRKPRHKGASGQQGDIVRLTEMKPQEEAPDDTQKPA